MFRYSSTSVCTLVHCTYEITERDKITERDSQSKSFDLDCESSSSPGTTGAAFSSWSRAISHTSNDLQGTFHALTVPQTPSVRQHFRGGRLSKSGAGGRFPIISGSMLAAAGQRRAGRTPRSVPLCCRHILRSHGAVQESLPHGATQHTHDWCFVKSHDWCFLNRLDAAKRNLAKLGP